MRGGKQQLLIISKPQTAQGFEQGVQGAEMQGKDTGPPERVGRAK